MKYLGRLFVMVMLAAAMVIPGLAGTASAQSGATDLCDEARMAGSGSVVAGLPIVWLTGGSGNQIVLGPDEGGAWLSGGSGNDVLCAWGSGNTLDGGSGNDVLVAPDGGNAFLGGSGNDTMIGVEGDDYNGGSGRNTIELLLPIISNITIDVSFTAVQPTVSYCRATATVENLDPTLTYTLSFSARLDGANPSVLATIDIGPGIDRRVYTPRVDLLKNSNDVQFTVGTVTSDWVTVAC